MDRRTSAALAAAGVGLGALAGAALARRHGYSFRDKVVLVTGGSRGLGLVMARRLADEGARLAILARNDEELRRATDELTQRGAEVLAITADVTQPAQCGEAVRLTAEHFGVIDVLINNAGVISFGPMENQSPQAYRLAMDVHFFGPLHLTLAALPHLKRSVAEGRGARVVNISSIGGKVGLPHMAAYVASKHALVGLSDALRTELRKDGVYVTTVAPGLLRTGSPRNIPLVGRHEQEYAWFKLGDSNPLMSASAEKAARQILEAARSGRAELTITWSAKIAALLDEAMPGTMAYLLALGNRVLPSPDRDAGYEKKYGFQSESAITRSPLATLTDRAAARNNELL